MKDLPEQLARGEVARLFPVLSDTSKKGRTTSILLACMSKVDELARELLAGVGQRFGARARLDTYTEVVFAKSGGEKGDRPDGLLVLTIGSRRWTALVEAKVGNSILDADQIERYRQLARDNQIDCVVTISNQFSTSPNDHPIEAVRKSRSRIPVIHWSWMHIFTTVDLLISRGEVEDKDQRLLLNELRRFLSHESAGVRGFDRMPGEWADVNRLIASGGDLGIRSDEARTVVGAWLQETRDLSLILSRMTETRVETKLPRAHIADPAQRLKDDIRRLCETRQLASTFVIQDAAATLEVWVDLARRCVDVGMTLRAPDDRKSAQARVNWLLRQVKVEDPENLHVRLFWPGRSPQTQHAVSDLRLDPGIASQGKEGLSPTSMTLFASTPLGGRFVQLSNFITDIETLAPGFYREVGANLVAWKKPAPRIREDRDNAEDVSTDAISAEADTFSG